MKLEDGNTLSSPSPTVGSALPTLCLPEPINIGVILEDDDLHLLNRDAQVRLTGAVYIDRYETIVRHGTPEFSARTIHSDKFLDITKSFVFHAKRNLIRIDLASLAVEVAQLPSSLSIMGHSSRDEDSLIPSTEPQLLKMSVKYMLKVASKLQQRDRKCELQQEILVLGTGLSEREGNLETAMRWPEGGYAEKVSLLRSTKLFPLMKTPRSNHMAQRSLVIKVLSYDPFIVRQQSESATTRIVIGLSFDDPDPDSDTPPCLSMSVDWALQPTTELVNGAAALRQEYTTLQLTDQGVLSGKRQKITTPTWQQEKSEFEGTTRWAAAEQGLCLAASTATSGTLAPRRLLAPTFFTETLHHTYNLSLKVSCQLPGRVFGHATHSVEFNLPVAVIYQAPGYTSDHSPPDYSA